MDHLLRLRTFRTVVERGGFSRAAEALDLAPGTVSKLINELEAHLGARLLQRSTRKLALTEAGRAFYERSLAALDAIDDAERAVTELNAAPRGLLRVSAPTSFGVRWLSATLPAFLARHPEVALEVALNDRFVDLLDEGFDLALRIADDLPDSALVARALGRVPRVLVASPGYLARAGTPRGPADLADHVQLVYTLSRTPGRWVLERDGRAEQVTVTGRLRVNNGLLLRESLVAGVGLTLTPRFMVDDLLASGALVELLPGWSAPAARLHAVLPHGRAQPPKVRAFIEHVAERFAAA